MLGGMTDRFDLILRNGTIVTSSGRASADIGVRDGKIQALGDLVGSTAEEELDCRGLHVLPGVIDTQVHFREPGLTHKEDIGHGSLAAVMGGVTTFFEMPNTDPPTLTPELLADKVEIARRSSFANFAFFVGASPSNVDELAGLEQLPGTPGIKIFAGSSTGSLLIEDEAMLRRVLQNGVQPCPIHSEDEPRLRERKALLGDSPHVREHCVVRDAEAARLCTERVLRLSRETGRPVHVLHISTREELPMLWEAKRNGVPATCEVTPQHMTFSAEDYETLGTKVQMNPPIRAKEHREAIWKALDDGLFDVFGSDHAPHTLEEKAQPYPKSPSGMPGVQTMLPLLLDFVSQGRISLETVVRMSSERPAELYGIRDRGTLVVGGWADLAVVDLSASFVVEKAWLKSKCGWSPFEGRTLRGKPVHTLVNGKIVVRDARETGAKAAKVVEFNWKDGT